MTSRRRRHPGRALGVVVAVAALGALAVGAVVVVLDMTSPTSALHEVCSAELDGKDWTFSPGQADNAALVAAVSMRRAMPARATTIALATALQESRLINIDYGDRDSVGLFQQRTSQGWGTIEQIMDPVYSTNKFYDGLVLVPSYTRLPITEAAQAVQRSGFPDAYAQHEVRSRAWASALTGFSTASVTCELAPIESAAEMGTVDDLAARVLRDFGELPVTSGSNGVTAVVDATPLSPAEQARVAWAVGHWGVASASETRVNAVIVADQRWTRESAAWQSVGSPEQVAAPGTVLFQLGLQ